MWIVVGYYTRNTVYEKHARNLVDSLRRFNIPYDVEAVDDLGGWYKNTQYKPTFLKRMLEKHHPHSVVYVDVDATFCRYPDYFDKLDSTLGVNIAVHILDHSKYMRKNHPPEMLSGTIFLKNTQELCIIIYNWVEECNKNPMLWDQVALSRVLRNHKFHLLPEEYCVIFDYMSNVKNPVIKHFQASRGERRKSANKTLLRQSMELTQKSKVVVQNGIVRIKRVNPSV